MPIPAGSNRVYGSSTMLALFFPESQMSYVAQLGPKTLGKNLGGPMSRPDHSNPKLKGRFTTRLARDGRRPQGSRQPAAHGARRFRRQKGGGRRFRWICHPETVQPTLGRRAVGNDNCDATKRLPKINAPRESRRFPCMTEVGINSLIMFLSKWKFKLGLKRPELSRGPV